MGGINIIKRSWSSEHENSIWCLLSAFFKLLKTLKISWYTSLHHLLPKENNIQSSCVDQCLNDYFVASRVPNSFGSLKHRYNFACVLLFYRYYSEFCSNKIRRLNRMNHVFLCNTRLSWQSSLVWLFVLRW